MIILGLETSCDETGAATVEGKSNSNKVKLLSNIVASSLPLHAKSGGIIPENAAREQIKFIIPVIKEALSKARLEMKDIDSIAITYGPGLIGSLLIGVETAKTLSYIYRIPLIPTNHLLGHIYANFIEPISNFKFRILNSAVPEFPAIALIVSGGHTDLVLMRQHGSIRWLGGTRDDAAGEALDKIGRILGLPYPGGPYIEQAAKTGDPNKFIFPRPLIGSNDFDFSFSGLKTAVFREVEAIKQLASPEGGLNNQTISDISASVQKTIIDVLVKKTVKAAKQYNAKSILLGGGVAANQTLRETFNFKLSTLNLGAQLFVPTKSLSTDNAAMIAATGFFNYKQINWQKVDANPSLYF